ncbi:MAG: TetR/AcrR family transcriptional regulator [bacterium]
MAVMASAVTSSDETRSRIARAAIRLFATQGFDGTSVREIAESAGVTKPVLYYYYGSKEKLYVAMIEECYERCRKHTAQSEQHKGPFRERLRYLLKNEFDYHVSDEETARMLYTVAFAPQRNSPNVNLYELEKPHLEILENVIRDGIESGEVRQVSVKDAAILLLGMINIHVMGLVVLGDPPTAEDVEQIVSVFVDGVGAK